MTSRRRRRSGKFAFLLIASAVARTSKAIFPRSFVATRLCPSDASFAVAIGKRSIAGGFRYGHPRVGQPIEYDIGRESTSGATTTCLLSSQVPSVRRMRRRCPPTPEANDGTTASLEGGEGFFEALRSITDINFRRLTGRRRRRRRVTSDGDPSMTSPRTRGGDANESERGRAVIVEDSLRARMKLMIEEAKGRVVITDAAIRRASCASIAVGQRYGVADTTVPPAVADTFSVEGTIGDDESDGCSEEHNVGVAGGKRQQLVRELNRRVDVNREKMRAVVNELAPGRRKIANITLAHDSDGDNDASTLDIKAAGAKETCNSVGPFPQSSALRHRPSPLKSSRLESLRLAAVKARNPDERRKLLAYLEALKIELEVDERIEDFNAILELLRKAHEERAPTPVEDEESYSAACEMFAGETF